MNLLKVTNAPIKVDDTPFGRGFNVVAFNNAGAAATLQGSDDGVTYTTLASLGAGTSDTAMQQVNLPQFVKLAAAGTVFLLAAG